MKIRKQRRLPQTLDNELDLVRSIIYQAYVDIAPVHSDVAREYFASDIKSCLFRSTIDFSNLIVSVSMGLAPSFVEAEIVIRVKGHWVTILFNGSTFNTSM